MCDYYEIVDWVSRISALAFFGLIFFVLANKNEDHPGRWYDAFIGPFIVIIDATYIKPKARWAQKLFVVTTVIFIPAIIAAKAWEGCVAI
ncbi:hypothetical protein A3762_03705 [Oleiphilus sp. HI0125]|nr:hypothetical protein A3762_03705 [Oleiphilus sp. HI0125]